MHSLEARKVEKMILRRNVDRVEDIQDIRTLLSRHVKLCDTHREKARLVQAQQAAEKGRVVEVIIHRHRWSAVLTFGVFVCFPSR